MLTKSELTSASTMMEQLYADTNMTGIDISDVISCSNGRTISEYITLKYVKSFGPDAEIYPILRNVINESSLKSCDCIMMAITANTGVVTLDEFERIGEAYGKYMGSDRDFLMGLSSDENIDEDIIHIAMVGLKLFNIVDGIDHTSFISDISNQMVMRERNNLN